MTSGDDEGFQVPHVSAPTRTLVREVGEYHQQLLWIDGSLPLPIGSVINLDDIAGGLAIPLDEERFPDGHADAEVIGVRLWGAASAAGGTLILEVTLRDPSETSSP